MAYLYNSGDSHRGDLRTGLQQRAAQAAGQASVDGGSGIKEVQAWWKKCQDWMAHFKEQTEPFVFNFKKLWMALSDKEAVAQSEVDAFMENA